MNKVQMFNRITTAQNLHVSRYFGNTMLAVRSFSYSIKLKLLTNKIQKMSKELLLLKHYIGNNVQVFNTDTNKVYNLVLQNNTCSIRNGVTLSDLINEPKIYIACLRPMSDLTKKFYYLNDEIDMCQDFSWCQTELKELAELNESYYTKFIKWEIMELLFEFSFDVFGLIKKGLAMDINTICVRNDG